MANHNTFILIIGLSILISACGEVSYKRGASVRDIEMAHAACRGVPESAFSACLQKQGWEIQKFDDSDLFAEVSVTDNRGATTATHESTAFVDVTEKQKSTTVAQSADTPAQTAQTQSAEVQEAAKATSATPTQPEASTSSAVTTPPAETQVEKKVVSAAVDPMKTYKINSWWKFGGTPEHLKKDQTNCIAVLGEAHQPDMAAQTYTRGLIECLHNNGWKALRQFSK
jgi:hypothetical protein